MITPGFVSMKDVNCFQKNQFLCIRIHIEDLGKEIVFVGERTNQGSLDVIVDGGIGLLSSNEPLTLKLVRFDRRY